MMPVGFVVGFKLPRLHGDIIARTTVAPTCDTKSRKKPCNGLFAGFV